jgi:hypothetical protein
MARATAFSKCEHTGPFRQADPRRTTARNDGAHERSSSGGPRPAAPSGLPWPCYNLPGRGTTCWSRSSSWGH